MNNDNILNPIETYDGPVLDELLVLIENIPNNTSSISNMLVNFAKEVYDSLNGKESLITSSSGFNVVKDRIVWYNRTSAGAPFIAIPKYFISKKHIVDYFIDEVAEKS
jgi:hypothetical protein